MSALTGPRQMILVTSRAKINNRVYDNIMAVAWHMPTSFNPFLYSISIAKKRFSYKLIKKSKVFCVNFMPASLKKEIIFCGSCSGSKVNKFERCKLEKIECKYINCSRIKQALGFLECKIIREIETGDHVIF